MKYAVLVLLAGCFPTPSAALVCSVDSDCAEGRTCESGFCVVSTDAGVEEDDAEQPDTMPDGPPAFDCKPFTTRLFVGCDLPEPGTAIDVTSGIATYNTDTGALSTGTSPPSINVTAGHVVSVEKITIAAGATLRVTGSKPLILASWSTIDIAGTIDVGSTATELGAGANPTECATHAATAGESNNDGAGGGGGGSMIAIGGNGGNGDNDDAAGGAGGAAVTAPLLLGGCAGASGGTGRQAGGAGGAGGGAVQLAALESITISGKINAGGAGGRGAEGENGGGGGGGSGGMIGLESAQVTVTGVLAANGGGGGGGSTNNNNAKGSAGQDGQLAATRATGGAPNNSGGGAGGGGGAGATTAGLQGQEDGGDSGGGGGGSCGFIIVASTSTASMAGTISPAATTVAR